MIQIKNFLIVLSMLFAMQSFAQTHNKDIDMSMFPKATYGYNQVYIQLPQISNEDDLKIEIFVGKEEMLDCNRHFLIGEINEQNLDGWGYTYYAVKSKGEIGGTLMACPDKKLTRQFVYLTPQILRYNSKLPIVFYVPEGFVVRYRIWKADNTMLEARIFDKDRMDHGTVNNGPIRSIEYTNLNNYFVKNNAVIPKSLKIETQRQFDAMFGAATVMGTKGRPTIIDFRNQFVVPIVLNTTNRNTKITVTEVTLGAKNEIIVYYKVSRANKQSFNIKPSATIAIDKKYSGRINLKED